MTRRLLCCLPSALLTLMLAACQSTPPPDTTSVSPAQRALEPVAILQHITGDDPAFASPQVLLVQSRQQLEQLGSRELIHRNVDWDAHTLVILAFGPQPTGGCWGRITAAQLQGDVLHLQGFANRPSPNQAVTQGVTFPYAAAVLPKLNVHSVRSDIQSVTGQPAPADQ
jgi:hypothetical protein